MSIFGNLGSNNATNPSNTFGNTNQPAAGTSLFGSTNTNTTTNPNPLQAQPTQPALFGSTNTNTNTNTGGGLFGSTNTNQNAPAPSAGGIFGNLGGTNQPAQTGGSLFGNQTQPAAGTSLFGNPSTNNQNPGTTGTSLFGNTTNNAPTPGGGGLFANGAQQSQAGLNNPLFGGAGNSTNTTNTGATGTGGGLFGSNPTNTGGGLFGANTNAQQPANTTGTTTGTGLFGNTQAAGSNLFGGAKPANGGGLFGSTAGTSAAPTTNQNPLFGGSLFGQPQQQQQQQPQQQQQQPSLFGSTGNNPLFGGNKSTLGTSALGGPQQNTGFGSSGLTPTNNLLTSRSTAGNQQQPADAQAQFVKLTQEIEGVYNAWNPASRDCRFQYYFYNLVDPKQVNLYGRPPNATNEILWEKAVRENPDSSCLVPVVAIGFDDLRSRVDAQTAQAASHLQKLNDLKSRLSALRTQHSVSNSSRLLRAASQQTQLTQRLMRLIQHLHLLIPTVRSSALTPEEEALRGKLEELEEEMRRSRVKSRLNELWALIGAVSASAERSGAAGGAGEWAVVDEDGLAQIAQILSEQQAGLQHLTKILQKDTKDLNVVLGNKNASGSADDNGSLQDYGESLWGSTSTLRASALA
ncbi:hypothetical protein GALMADRAFT_246158 [Galerina marginata CBS 339.88]|uniref:Nucleoporin Nup54 alpha-helical domain-containing protein n=1 Tax=Galerina marginata (strain CBS 339.88) TaxID=685588 RepID=A0A067TAU1_GALM3|nr:hypothetical protein GALMADRAFT_246158 [Galerina marginata CBS 339.88]